jgi:rubrerythrin
MKRNKYHQGHIKTMNSAETIIELAIKEEEYAYQLFIGAESCTKDKNIIKKIHKLAAIKKAHKAKLQSLYEVLTGSEFIENKIQNMRMPDAVLYEDIKINNIKELAEYALTIEDNAELTYRTLAESTNITEIKELFTALANEDAENKELLKRFL